MALEQPGYIPETKIDEVRQAADLVEVVGRRVRLTKKGKDFWGVCPFHGDSNPSLKVDKARGTWYCFGCHLGGNVFHFLMRDEGLSFPEAVREMAHRYGVQLPTRRLTPQQRQQVGEREQLGKVMNLAQEFFQKNLASAAGKGAREYLLTQRELPREALAQFGLGLALESWEGLHRHLASHKVPLALMIKAGMVVSREKGDGAYDRFRGRVTFPIRDQRGRVISFGGRILGPGEPKYLNGPESPLFNKSSSLYNLDQARLAMVRKDRALVVEGYFDVISLAARGLAETVAPMGTALTNQQVRSLGRITSNVILVFDGDQAGRQAATRALPIFLEEQVTAKAVLLPGGEDPDSLVRSQGLPALERLLDEARPLVEVVLDRMLAEGDLSSPEGRSQLVGQAGEVIKAIRDPLVAWLYLEDLCRRLELPTQVVARRLGIPLPARGHRPPSQVGGSGEQLVLSRESVLLEAALAHPAAARFLCEQGALDDFDDPQLAQVAQALGSVVERGEAADPEAVMQALPDPALAFLVNRLAGSGPDLDERQAVEQARKYLAARERRRQTHQLRQLSRALAAAEQAGDLEEMARIHAMRRQMSNRQAPVQLKKE